MFAKIEYKIIVICSCGLENRNAFDSVIFTNRNIAQTALALELYVTAWVVPVAPAELDWTGTDVCSLAFTAE